MVTVNVIYFLSATYLAMCKNFLIEVEDEKDYVEPSPVENTANNQRRFWGPWQKANALKSEKEEIKLLKEGMEKVFGKDWNPSDVKEAFDISDDGDYVDGDTEESQLLLNQKAQARAEYVAKTGEFKHPRGGQKYKDGSPVLENLFQGKGIAKGRQQGTANAPTREWLTSSGHKARLDDKVVTKLGVGNAVGANGVKYTVGLYHPNTANVRG